MLLSFIHSNYHKASSSFYVFLFADVKRDEDYDMIAKVKQFLQKENDDFLGQKIICLTSVSGADELWYNLGM